MCVTISLVFGLVFIMCVSSTLATSHQSTNNSVNSNSYSQHYLISNWSTLLILCKLNVARTLQTTGGTVNYLVVCSKEFNPTSFPFQAPLLSYERGYIPTSMLYTHAATIPLFLPPAPPSPSDGGAPLAVLQSSGGLLLPQAAGDLHQ